MSKESFIDRIKESIAKQNAILEEMRCQPMSWLDIKVDTLIEVRDSKTSKWKSAYFSDYEVKSDTVFVFRNGTTSITSENLGSKKERFEYMKLCVKENN